MSARTVCDGPDCGETRRGSRYGDWYEEDEDLPPKLDSRYEWIAVEHDEDRLHGDFCSFECLAAWAMSHAIDRQDAT